MPIQTPEEALRKYIESKIPKPLQELHKRDISLIRGGFEHALSYCRTELRFDACAQSQRMELLQGDITLGAVVECDLPEYCERGRGLVIRDPGRRVVQVQWACKSVNWIPRADLIPVA